MKNNNSSNPNQCIIIYGTGEIAKKIFLELKEEGKENQIAFFLDSLMSKKSFCNKTVHSPAFLDEINANGFHYYLGTYTNTKSMKEELLRHNVLEENIIGSSKRTSTFSILTFSNKVHEIPILCMSTHASCCTSVIFEVKDQ